jgi:inner membrane protein
VPTFVTHAVFGAAFACAAPRTVRVATFALAAAAISALPDADVIGFAFGIPYSHPLGHRGLSHGLPFAVALGALAWLWRRARGLPHALALGILLATACASHGVLDAATDGGLGIGFWIPFSDTRFFLPWRPIPVSPLEPAAFFSARGAAILAAEVAWVWLPVLSLAAGVAWTRRRA